MEPSKFRITTVKDHDDEKYSESDEDIYWKKSVFFSKVNINSPYFIDDSSILYFISTARFILYLKNIRSNFSHSTHAPSKITKSFQETDKSFQQFVTINERKYIIVCV